MAFLSVQDLALGIIGMAPIDAKRSSELLRSQPSSAPVPASRASNQRCGGLVACASLLQLALGTVHAEPPEVSITRIEARLFFDHTGTFSLDVLNSPGVFLRNVPIGEGSPAGASTATLLIVQLAGPPGSYLPGRILQLSARWRWSRATPKGATHATPGALDTTAEVGSFGADGRSFVGFWLPGTGCGAVAVNARLRVGRAMSQPTKAIIPFSCGE